MSVNHAAKTDKKIRNTATNYYLMGSIDFT